MVLMKEFTDAVAENKMMRVRIMLKNSMLADSSLRTFHAMLSYAEEHMTGLYDPHDGERLKHSASDWTEDYMNQQMAAIVDNFSKERVAVLEDIVKHLFGSQVKEKADAERTERRSQDASRQGGSGNFTGQQIAGGAVAAVGVGALVGGILSSHALIAAVGGIAIVGGIVLIATGGSEEV